LFFTFCFFGAEIWMAAVGAKVIKGSGAALSGKQLGTAALLNFQPKPDRQESTQLLPFHGRFRTPETGRSPDMNK